jgi:hypothetical protein
MSNDTLADRKSFDLRAEGGNLPGKLPAGNEGQIFGIDTISPPAQA